MSEKLVTVIVPIYKVEQYINRCVDSIISQTYKNLEIILVDDGSPDSCGKICDDYAKSDSRIKVIHKENGGLSDARNAGIAVANGDYLMFVDSDDWVDEDFCESAVSTLEKNNSDIVVFGYNRVDESDNLLDSWNLQGRHKYSKQEALKKLFRSEIDNYAWNKIYKRSLFHEIRYPKGKLWEDIGTTYLLFAEAESIYISNCVTYNYLMRKSSITGQRNRKGELDMFTQRLEQYEFAQKNFPGLSKEILPLLVFSALRAYIFAGNDRNGKDICERADQFLTSHKQEVKKLSAGFKSTLFYFNKQLYRNMARIVEHNRNINLERKLLAIPKKVVKRLFRLLKRKNAKRSIQQLWDTNFEKRCYVIGTPDHDNLGDHAIALSTIQYLAQILKEYQIIDITEDEYWKYRDSLIANTNPDKDLIVLQGGGNIGDQYPFIERIRKDIIQYIDAEKIVFPQTIYFSDSSQGNAEKKNIKDIYTSSKTLCLTAREEKSFSIMQDLFEGCKVYLIPDIVLRYRITVPECQRKNVLFCLRTDKEAKLSLNDRNYLKKQCQKFGEVHYTDTCVKEYISKKERASYVDEKLNEFAKYKLIVTDRLHGMVFAALTGTPCIVLANYNYKIRGVYQWLSNVEYITFVDDVKSVEIIIDKMQNNQELCDFQYDYSTVDSYYSALGEVLLEKSV